MREIELYTVEQFLAFAAALAEADEDTENDITESDNDIAN
jgi:hypothetical protein